MILLTFLLCLGGEICDWVPGEFIVLKFDGPVTYSFQLKTGEMRETKVENEDTLSLENKDTIESNQTIYSHIRIGADGLRLFPGFDKSLSADPNSNNFVYTAQEVALYLGIAALHVKNKNEGPLNNSIPIFFSGNFLGVESHRKDYICKDKGHEIYADKKVPYKDCMGNEKEYTGQMIVTYYDKDSLSQKMAGTQNTMVIGAPQSPVEIRVKNASYTPPKVSATTGDTKATPGEAPASEKGACGSSLHRGVPVPSNWGVWGIFVWVPAAFGLLRQRRKA